MLRRFKLPSPAMTVALIALFVALAGSATAGVVVSFAQRAGTANNAKKLQGKTAAQVAAMPGPASTIQDLVEVRTSTGIIPPGIVLPGQVSCQEGERVIAGGYSAVGGVIVPGDSHPTGDDTWTILFNNVLGVTPASVTLYAVCVE
jgi:hypothetical protein